MTFFQNSYLVHDCPSPSSLFVSFTSPLHATHTDSHKRYETTEINDTVNHHSMSHEVMNIQHRGRNVVKYNTKGVTSSGIDLLGCLGFSTQYHIRFKEIQQKHKSFK
jgi:hypothetical protein